MFTLWLTSFDQNVIVQSPPRLARTSSVSVALRLPGSVLLFVVLLMIETIGFAPLQVLCSKSTSDVPNAVTVSLRIG